MKKILETLLWLLGWLYFFAAVPLGIMFLYNGLTYNRYFHVLSAAGLFFLLWKVANWLDVV